MHVWNRYNEMGAPIDFNLCIHFLTQLIDLRPTWDHISNYNAVCQLASRYAFILHPIPQLCLIITKYIAKRCFAYWLKHMWPFLAHDRYGIIFVALYEWISNVNSPKNKHSNMLFIIPDYWLFYIIVFNYFITFIDSTNLLRN